MVEIEAVRSTRDFNEVGSLTPNVRAGIAFNSDSKMIPVARFNGVLMAQTTPTGGRLAGQSSVMNFNDKNWEDAAIKMDDGQHLNWPSAFRTSGWWAEPGNWKQNEKYEKQVKELSNVFQKAQAYMNQSNNKTHDLSFESLRPIFEGKQRLYIHAHSSGQITDALEFCKTFNIKFPVIVGGYEAHKVLPQLKERNTPVLLDRIHSLPVRDDDDIHHWYKLPKILQDAGIVYGLQTAGDMAAQQARNLPFMAGTAFLYGLGQEQAIRAITLYPAQIMGVQHKVGSIEIGKDATLFVSTGDALNMATNNLELIYIAGENISLENHQNNLYKRYKKTK